jgi:hypothetical protein
MHVLRSKLRSAPSGVPCARAALSARRSRRKTMKIALILSIALGVAAAAPVMSDPLDTAGPPTSGHLRIHHRATFAKATALAAPSTDPSKGAREADGLSRNDDDCNHGCIDH